MYSSPSLQGTAGGSIVMNRVVCVSTVADNQFLQSAAASSANIGLAQGGSRRAPGTGDDDGNAAIAGETVQIWGPGSIGIGEASGAITAGDRVTADSNGRLVTTTNAGDRCVGIALEAATLLGDMIEVMVSAFEVG
jgi:Uncharacterized conserved protein (DUF2190)